MNTTVLSLVDKTIVYNLNHANIQAIKELISSCENEKIIELTLEILSSYEKSTDWSGLKQSERKDLLIESLTSNVFNQCFSEDVLKKNEEVVKKIIQLENEHNKKLSEISFEINNKKPTHELGDLWEEAYKKTYGLPPTDKWHELSKTDRNKIIKILDSWLKKKEEQPKNRTVLFDSDSHDSQIRQHLLYGTNLFNSFAISEDLETLFRYNGKHFEVLEYKAFENYVDTECLFKLIPDGYNNGKVRALSDMIHKDKKIKRMKPQKTGLVGLNNSIVEITKEGNIIKHKFSMAHNLLSVADYDYEPDKIDCPNFEKWIEHASKHKDPQKEEEKIKTILASLYMVAANRYDWQKFIEIIGEGGTGKSIFMRICQILAGGKKRTCPIDIEALEGRKGKGPLINLIGPSLIICPDQPTTVGELDMIKRITGNDPVTIPVMHKSDIKLDLLPAVLVITANQPITSTDRSSALFRRRVTILLNNVVTDIEKDINLSSKLEKEASAIFNMVISSFESPEQANAILTKAISNEDKIDAMLSTEPLTQWIVDCLTPLEGNRERIGSRLGFDQAKKGGQTNSSKQILKEAEIALYPNYLAWCDSSGITKTLSHIKFSTALLSKIKQLKTIGFIDSEIIKPSNKAHLTNISINKNSILLNDLRETVKNYCQFREEI